MTSRKPLVVASGVKQEMPAGDTVDPTALPISSTTDAQAGTRDDVLMTPLKVAQTIAANSSNTALALAIALG